jgi:hypothetical protein
MSVPFVAAGLGWIQYWRAAIPGRRAAAWLMVAVTVWLGGCQSADQTGARPTVHPRFFLESADDRGVPFVLPRSGVRLLANPQPVINEGDIANVELMQVDLGRCLMFQLTPAAARDLYRMTASHQGRRLVLLLDDAPIGARQIERPFNDGQILIFVELDDAALPALVADLKRSSAALQRELARKP